MGICAALDVSQEFTAICVIDDGCAFRAYPIAHSDLTRSSFPI